MLQAAIKGVFDTHGISGVSSASKIYEAIKASSVSGLSGTIKFDSACLRKGPHDYSYLASATADFTKLGSFDGSTATATLLTTPSSLVSSDRTPAYVTALIVRLFTMSPLVRIVQLNSTCICQLHSSRSFLCLLLIRQV